jgi:hypothetical protein
MMSAETSLLLLYFILITITKTFNYTNDKGVITIIGIRT